MHVTFVGGPWHGVTRDCPAPLPPRIGASDLSVYVPLTDHPATGGVLADPFELSDTYALVELGPRELLERLEDVMLVQ